MTDRHQVEKNYDPPSDDIIDRCAEVAGNQIRDIFQHSRELTKNDRPVVYTQAQHDAIFNCFVSVLTQCSAYIEIAGDRRIALEKRVAELEARPTLKYCGVWEKDWTYQPGNFATDQGGVWHCNTATKDRPGSNMTWTLAVKQGKAAR